MDRNLPLFIRSFSDHIIRHTGSALTAPRVGTTSVQLLNLFLGFQLVNQIFLPILIATFVLSKSVRRHPTVVSVCVTWIISGFVSSLLLYAGKHVGPEPPKMLCILQASLLDGVLPMDSVAILALMFQVNLSIRNPKAKACGTRTYALIIAPYMAFFCFATSAAILAVQKPEAANRARRFFYCSFPSHINNAFAIFTALTLLTAFGYAISLGVFLCKNWRSLRQAGSLDLQFLGRVGGFGLYVFLSFVLSVLSIHAPRSPFPDLFVASVGPALFLFLSTQPDVLRAWLRRSKRVPPRVTDDWIASVTEQSKTHDLDDEDMEESKVHDLDLEDPHGAEDLSGVKGEVDVVHNSANLNSIQPDESRYREASLASDFSAVRGAIQGVNVASSYRFARPGMI